MINFIKWRLLYFYRKFVLRKERVFISGQFKLKYLFLNNNKSDRLLVIFSGFPARVLKPRYNYISTLKDINISKLFILDDFGPDGRGAYYLGKNKDFYIEKAVFELIESIRRSKNLDKSCIITTGSSKGGFASLFFTFKYGYGTTIAGAPQVFLGDYLAVREHLIIMRHICGSTTKNDQIYLNNLITKEIEKNLHKPNVFIHVSKNEHHYKEHVIPLTEKLKALNYNFELNTGEYDKHGEVGQHFQAYLKTILKTYFINK